MAKTARAHSPKRRTKPKVIRSAVRLIPKSNLDLVPALKRHGKLATTRDYANMDFEPWKREPGMGKNELFPSAQLIHHHGVGCRLAYAVMLMSRDELIANHRETKLEGIDAQMAILANASEFLKTVAFMVEGAYTRMLAAAAAATINTPARSRRAA